MTEEVLIKVELPNAEQNNKRVDELTKEIGELNDKSKDLSETNKKLAESGKKNSDEYIQNAKQIEINKQKVQENTATRKGLIQTLIAEDNSIKGLRVQNAELIKQRDSLNRKTKEGQAEIQRINAIIDSNTKEIAKNSSAQEKQRMNVGAYFEDIKRSIPFFNEAEKAQKALTVGVNGFGKALIATGIGLFILAIGSLITYIKGSDEASDRFAKTLKTLGFVFDELKLVVEKVGGFIFDTIEFIAGGVERIVTFISPTIKAGLEAAKQAGAQIAKIEDDIDNKETALIVKRAETNRRVFELRENAITQEGALKRKTIQEAIDLEKALSNEEVELANMRLELFDKENAQRIQAGKLTQEQLTKRAELLAASIDAEAQASQATLRFQKELEKLRDEDLKKYDEATQERIKLAQEEVDKKFEIQQEAIAQQLDADEEARKALLKLKEEQDKEDLKIESDQVEQVEVIYDDATKRRMDNLLRLAKLKEDLIKKGLTAAQAEAKIEQDILNKKLRATELGFELASGLLKKNTIAYKVAASGKTIIDTYENATKAYQVGLEAGYPIGIVLGPVLAGLAVAQGLASLAQINGVQFAKGGVLMMKRSFGLGGISDTGGVLNGPSHAQGGIPFSVGGRTGFEAEGGEAIINKRSTSMFRDQLSAINVAGGGVAFQTGGVVANETRIAAQSAQSQLSSNDLAALINNVQLILVREDYEVADRNHRELVKTAKVV